MKNIVLPLNREEVESKTIRAISISMRFSIEVAILEVISSILTQTCTRTFHFQVTSVDQEKP